MENQKEGEEEEEGDGLKLGDKWGMGSEEFREGMGLDMT